MKKYKVNFILCFLLLVLISFLSIFFFFHIRQNISQKEFEKDLEQSLSLYADWVLKNQTQQGDFNYQLDVSTGEIMEGYNIVRQAGTLYSLAHVYKYEQKDEYLDGIERGIQFFSEMYEEVEDESSLVRINHNGVRKSNAVALYLLALIEYMEVNPTAREQYLEISKSLANYLLYTQKKSGGFWYLLDPLVESDYNNGESFYALVRMYKLSGEKRYLEGAKLAAQYIIREYRNREFSCSIYPWAMKGFSHLYNIEKDEIYWDFMYDYTVLYLVSNGKRVTDYFKGENGLMPGGNLGVFVEGLAHVSWIAREKDPNLNKRVTDFMSDSLAYLMTMQINGPRSEIITEFELISGGICYDQLCQIQRVDITHHNLSAIYLYLEYAR